MHPICSCNSFLFIVVATTTATMVTAGQTSNADVILVGRASTVLMIVDAMDIVLVLLALAIVINVIVSSYFIMYSFII